MNAEERSLTKAIAGAQATIARHKSNLKFARLPAAEKRVAIAKDVVAMTKLPSAKRPQFASCYFEFDNGAVTQEQLCTDPSVCTVCGIGSLMLAHLRLFNDVPGDDDIGKLRDFEGIADRLKGYFSTPQLGWIEAAFEGSHLNLGSDLSDADFDAIRAWRAYSADTSRTDCLREIMLNLIRNKGTFRIREVPKQ